MFLLILSLASAAPCDGAPLAEETFRGIVDRAVQAIYQGDVDAHREASTELRTRVACLSTPLRSQTWADYLVSLALVQRAASNDQWKRTLSNALELAPDHTGIPKTAQDEFDAAPPRPVPGTAQSLPNDRIFLLDGAPRRATLPAMEGLHILQRDKGATSWETVLVEEGRAPDGWVQPPVPAAPAVVPVKPSKPDVPKEPKQTKKPRPRPDEPSPTRWGSLSLSVGRTSWSQTPTEAAQHLRIRREPGLSIGLDTAGSMSFAGPLGAFWTADLQASYVRDARGANRPLMGGSGFVGLSVGHRLSAWVGVGGNAIRFESQVDDTPPGDQLVAKEGTLLLPHYLIGGAVRAGAYDAHAGFGYGINTGLGTRGWSSHVRGSIGYRPSERTRLGILARWSTAALGDATIDDPRERVPFANVDVLHLSMVIGLGF